MQTVFTIDHLKGRAVRSIFGLLLVSYAVFRCTDHYNHGGVWRIQLFSSFTIPDHPCMEQLHTFTPFWAPDMGDYSMHGLFGYEGPQHIPLAKIASAAKLHPARR